MHIFEQENKFQVIVEKGENLVEKLTEVANEYKIKGGQITGLGAIKNVELGYYHLDSKNYHRMNFGEKDFELISLNGNISLKDGNPFIHVHASMGDEKFEVFGGHLFEAEVAVTAEVFITPLGVMPERQHDTQIGLDLICQIKP